MTLITLSALAHATITNVSVQSPIFSGSATNVNSPVHFQATAESSLNITGYVVYVDSQIAFRNFSPSLDAWVILAPGTTHIVQITAWDSSGATLSTTAHTINVVGVVQPAPPPGAVRILGVDDVTATWAVDNNHLDVGGECSDGSIGTYTNSSDPNTANAPNYDGHGQHFVLTSKCQYDDSLFYWKYSSALANRTNFLWDFWFYIPESTLTYTVEAFEFDLFQAVQLSDGVHEFMFGSQCDYATNQWQLWLPLNGGLAWVDAGISPCQFAPGSWHHLSYFLQRVTGSGYQRIPKSFGSTTDTNSYLRFGAITVDSSTHYLGGRADSTIPYPAWSPTFGVQHQLDSAVSGVTIDEYITEESVVAW